MADLRGFDANQVEPSSDFEPVPAGKYLAVITESEMKPTKAGTGHYLQLTFACGPAKSSPRRSSSSGSSSFSPYRPTQKTDQTRAVPSLEPEASVFPSGENANA
jgi:hypothetical protein